MPHAGCGVSQPGIRASPYEPGVYFVREETWHVRTLHIRALCRGHGIRVTLTRMYAHGQPTAPVDIAVLLGG